MIYIAKCDLATLESPHDYIVKVGVAEDPLERIRTLQIGNPFKLTLLESFPGNKLLEKVIHRSFASYRVRGEWFLPEEPLLEYIEKAGC